MPRKKRDPTQEIEVLPEVLPPAKHSREGLKPVNAYGDATVERAIELLCEYPVAEVARQLNISRRTLTEWRSKFAGEINATRSFLLADKLEQVVMETLKRIDESKLDAASAHSLAVIAGILTDKRVALIGTQRAAESNYRARVMWRNTDGSEMGVEIN